MGPNDTSSIVWAISKFFYYFLLCFINTNNTIDIFKGFRKVAVEETGLNNARCVIWAISESFILFSCLINSNNYI